MKAAVQWRSAFGGDGFNDIYVATDGDTVMDELREVL